MDSSWATKCGGAMWQSSSEAEAAAIAQSSQLQSQDSPNLMLNGGHNFYRHAMPESSSLNRKVMLEPSFPVTSSSCNLVHADQGNSFISFLTGPPSVLQYDTQHSKPFIPSSNVSDINSSSIFAPPRKGASIEPSFISLQNHDNRYLKIGGTCPVVSSRMVANCGQSSSSCSANVNGQSSELAKVVNHQRYHGNEQVKGFSSLSSWKLSTPSPRDIGQPHCTTSQASTRVLEGKSLSCQQSSSITTDCPRVFCLYASGALLLSNTGLLGVRCSCHGLHMSISKFSEHSGLLDVNPGHAVHVDSGETIAQWRKVYFQQFGIRIPDDHCGWDWPEGFSVAAGVVKTKGSMPGTLRSAALSNVVGYYGDDTAPWNDLAFKNNHDSGQKLVNEVLPYKTRVNAQDNGNFLNRFIGTAQSNVQALAANQIAERYMLGCSPVSNLTSPPENVSQSDPAYFASISKRENAFASLTSMSMEKNLGRDDDDFKFHNLKSVDILDRTIVSSNIELRLGQPSQQNQTLNANVSAFDTHVISAKDHPQKSLLMEPLIHESSARVTDKSREYLNSAAYTARSSTTREPSKINFVKHAAGVYSARSSVRSVQFNDVAARGSSISTFLSNIENPSNGILQSNPSSNMVNGSCVMPKKPLCGSLTDKCNPTSHPRMKGKIMEAKTGGHAASSAHIAHEVNLRCPPKSVGTLTSSYVVRETSNDACFGICDKSSHPHQVSAMPADASDGRITFKTSEKTSRVRSGYDDHGFLRSVNSLPLDSGPTLPSQTISSSITSLAVPSITNTSTNREGITSSPCLVNEKLQILAVGEVMEHSNQDQAITYLGINQNQGSTYNSFCSKVKSSIAIPSKSGKIREETNLCSKEDAPELAMESTNSKVICQIEGDVGKSAHISVLEFSAATEEKSLCLGDTGVQCELLHYPSPTAQPSIRLGGSEKHIGPSYDHGKSCQRIPYAYVQDKCNCVAQQNCLDRYCDFKSKRSLDGFREEDGSLNGCTSMFTSNTDKDRTTLKDKATSVGQIGELLKPNLIPVERNAFQWKDVPCKTTVMGKVTCKDRTPELLDGRKTVEDHRPDADSKCCNRSAQGTECIKEQEVSNISSKCSAPAITQTSVRVSIEDSCTDGARGSNCANNHVVDQGSGIEKCWSSDDAPDSGTSTQFECFSSKSSLIDEGSSEAFPDRSSRTLIDELRLRNSLTVKKVRTEVYSELTEQKCEIHIKSGKRKRATKWKRLNESFYASAKSSDNDENPICMGSSEQESDDWEGADMLLQPSQGRSDNVGAASKRSKSRLSLLTNGFRGLHRFCHNRGEEIDRQMLNTPFDDCIETPKSSHGERFKSNQVSFVANQILNQKAHCTDTETTTKCNSVNRAIVSSTMHLSVRKSIARPIVCGTYGIISNGNKSKAVKILSLGKILRNTRRCTHGENSALELSTSNSIKNTVKQKNNYNDAISTLKQERIRGGHSAATWRVSNPGNCVEVMEMACPPYGKNADEVSYMMEKGRHSRYKQSSFVSACGPNTSFKSKSKEVRKRSLYELTTKGKDSSCASFSGTKHLDCVSETKCRYPKQLLKKAKASNDQVGEAYSTEISNGQESKHAPDSDAFCCVCGKFNNDNTNYLLECSGCLIMVHQACYGISSVPKFHWYCRPCKTSSKNVVCVLCGYRGGAMTSALQSQNIVRSLLDAWNTVTESRPENSVSPSEAFEDRLNTEGSSKSYLGGDAPSSIRPAYMESSLAAMWKEDLQKELHAQTNSYCPIIDSMVHNSITAGVADSTVKQWVHMVCGLWTPGTRCPNVDTMNAFDVSGVSFPKENVVCSICNCLGGSCIRCRVIDCSIHFHPWCAHQKGLLQSEVEGADNEKVGFYGRCELHSTQPHHLNGSAPRDSKSSPGQKYLTCARIEAYEGRKQEGSRHSIQLLSNGTAGCHVPQEQLNAWNHINGQKAYARGLPKMPVGRASEVETDCRKEYTRYKQLKSWKHLVVYKSGIHALGLYTSSFISRGAMVVEYVGEIVGLRVADRRENDYQSGKKLQYKSACYFFRIDKEHIIDATCKGGIARFVNHSCQPNCVAKVITVRNEKKVVFFAERDIYPGEEITYDYHFNREDEGKKIPCLCNAKNCRRYLN